MEITIIQALLIGLWTAFCYAGMLFGIYTNRCIVLSFGVGVILGDIPTALQCGAIGELAFMGFGVGAGGTVPPNPIGPGIIGTLMAITMSSVTPESALPISIPFAVAIQFLQTAIYTVRAGAPESAAKALAEKNFSKFRRISNMTVILFAVVIFYPPISTPSRSAPRLFSILTSTKSPALSSFSDAKYTLPSTSTESAYVLP